MVGYLLLIEEAVVASTHSLFTQTVDDQTLFRIDECAFRDLEHSKFTIFRGEINFIANLWDGVIAGNIETFIALTYDFKTELVSHNATSLSLQKTPLLPAASASPPTIPQCL